MNSVSYLLHLISGACRYDPKVTSFAGISVFGSLNAGQLNPSCLDARHVTKIGFRSVTAESGLRPVRCINAGAGVVRMLAVLRKFRRCVCA